MALGANFDFNDIEARFRTALATVSGLSENAVVDDHDQGGTPQQDRSFALETSAEFFELVRCGSYANNTTQVTALVLVKLRVKRSGLGGVSSQTALNTLTASAFRAIEVSYPTDGTSELTFVDSTAQELVWDNLLIERVLTYTTIVSWHHTVP